MTRLESNFDKFSREESFNVANLDSQLIQSQTIIWGMPINVERKASTFLSKKKKEKEKKKANTLI